MGLLSHRVKEDIKPGDHIYTYRAGYTYSHHGIYVGEGRVIHFTPDHRRNLSTPSSSSFDATSCFSSSSSSYNHTSCVSSSSSSFTHPSCVSSSSSIFDQTTGISSLCPNLPDCGFRLPDNGVTLSCVDCFLGRGSPCVYQYGVSSFAFLVKARGGTCTTAKSDLPETVIYRANFLLHIGFPEYDVMCNNCEDFALYCKTGLLDTRGLGSSGQASLFVGAEVAAVISIPFRLLMSNPVDLTAVSYRYLSDCYCEDIGVSSNAVEVPVEALGPSVSLWLQGQSRKRAANRGASPSSSRS